MTIPEWTLTDEDPPNKNGLYLACECPPGGTPTVFIGYWQERFQRWIGSPFDEEPIHGSKLYWMPLPDYPDCESRRLTKRGIDHDRLEEGNPRCPEDGRKAD